MRMGAGPASCDECVALSAAVEPRLGDRVSRKNDAPTHAKKAAIFRLAGTFGIISIGFRVQGRSGLRKQLERSRPEREASAPVLREAFTIRGWRTTLRASLTDFHATAQFLLLQ